MSQLPAGPGNVLTATWDYLRDPYESMLSSWKRYGDPYTSPSFLGKMVVTGDPAGVRALTTAADDTYDALAADLLGPVLGRTNLVMLSGQRHTAMRKLQSPPFHGPRMRAYGQIIHDVTVEHTGRWPKDRSFHVHRTMQEISLDVIVRAIFGLTEEGPRKAFEHAIIKANDALKPSFLFMPALRKKMFGLSAWGRFRKAHGELAVMLNNEVESRRANPQPREDILSQLMDARYDDGTGLTEEELLDQMVNLTVAGHETTASALAWAFFLVHNHPPVLERLVKEVLPFTGPDVAGKFDSEGVAHLPYLDAVCNETLRVKPVAPLTGRTLRKDFTLKGYELAKGTNVGLGIVLSHFNPEVFPEPEKFLPDRFLGRTFAPYEFLPFGGGTRRCLGAAFAMYEMKIVLATVLGRHRLRWVGKSTPRPVVRSTIVGPGGGIPMALN